MKLTRQNKFNITRQVITYLGFVVAGMLLGMLLQQVITQSTMVKIAEGLEGTTFNIEVDINETLMVDKTYEILKSEGFNFTEDVNDGSKNG